ncbi:MAG: hypothetical protein IPI89_05475 [Propionivibrio sp.]|nr:hypothetical protein [Propionivibrio sp.]
MTATSVAGCAVAANNQNTNVGDRRRRGETRGNAANPFDNAADHGGFSGRSDILGGNAVAGYAAGVVITERVCRTTCRASADAAVRAAVTASRRGETTTWSAIGPAMRPMPRADACRCRRSGQHGFTLIEAIA